MNTAQESDSPETIKLANLRTLRESAKTALDEANARVESAAAHFAELRASGAPANVYSDARWDYAAAREALSDASVMYRALDLAVTTLEARENDTAKLGSAVLLCSDDGRFGCALPSHAPHPGSDAWCTNGWREMTTVERGDFEAGTGRAPACPSCEADARRTES